VRQGEDIAGVQEKIRQRGETGGQKGFPSSGRVKGRETGSEEGGHFDWKDEKQGEALQPGGANSGFRGTSMSTGVWGQDENHFIHLG